MKNVVIFYDHLEYFTAIWYNLLPFGIVCGHLVFTFWYVWTKKNLATLLPNPDKHSAVGESKETKNVLT
jgi:hypothetical protein